VADAKPDMPVIDERYHADLMRHAAMHGANYCQACELGRALASDLIKEDAE